MRRRSVEEEKEEGEGNFPDMGVVLYFVALRCVHLSNLWHRFELKMCPLNYRYTLRGRITEGVRAKLSFELEVCMIPSVNVVGIRRKRLKGDAWCYKRVCEQVLKMASIQAAA